MEADKEPTQNYFGLINNIPFFREFSQEQKREIGALNNRVDVFEPKATIVNEGGEDITVFVLLKAEAIVTRNDLPKVVINTLSMGALFGEVSFLTKTPRTTNIIAKTEAKVLRLDAEMFSKLKSETRDKLKDKFIEVLVSRISEMNSALVKLKVELEAISHAAADYQQEFDRILKSGKTMKEVFGGINTTITGLIR
ncbi:MAG: cyclic nucleotide-binding domain-containing protein [Nitrospinota bacterium]